MNLPEYEDDIAWYRARRVDSRDRDIAFHIAFQLVSAPIDPSINRRRVMRREGE